MSLGQPDQPAWLPATREEPAIFEEQVRRLGDPIDLLLDRFDPRLTVAFVRPWLARPSLDGASRWRA